MKFTKSPPRALKKYIARIIMKLSKNKKQIIQEIQGNRKQKNIIKIQWYLPRGIDERW